MKKLDYTTIFFAIMGSFLVLFILIPILNLMVSSNIGAISANLQDPQVISALFVSVYSAVDCYTYSNSFWCSISIHPCKA